METLSWIALTLCVLLLLAWYLSYSAARLDRLHAKVEGALSALDAHVVRRAEASLELANPVPSTRRRASSWRPRRASRWSGSTSAPSRPTSSRDSTLPAGSRSRAS